MHPNPPGAMGWDEYRERATADWDALLNSNEGCDERRIHQFLVSNPSFVPGARSMTGLSGHAPFPRALLSQSPLIGIGTKIPDFIWLAHDSGNFTPVLIEIESQCKTWFTDRGDPRHELTQAMNQLAHWRAWLNRPENVTSFYEHFHVPEEMRRYLTFAPEFVLIYGRRREFDQTPELKRLRAQFERTGQTVMTFDRLEASRHCDGYICATKTSERYRALSVPATIRLGPNVAKSWLRIEGVPDAIMANDLISPDRKAFLLERLPYWNDWARRDEPSVRNLAHWE
jgi:hypothetical protein